MLGGKSLGLGEGILGLVSPIATSTTEDQKGGPNESLISMEGGKTIVMLN